MKAGVAVHAFNHRDIEGIYGMIQTVGALVGAPAKATALVEELAAGVVRIRAMGAALPCRVRVYFEEWDEPMICGIRWVSELIEIAGGQDVFREKARSPGAQGRSVSVDEVATASPDLIIGSWCGKKFVPGRVTSRPGLEQVAAVQNKAVHEIKSPIILQPGPAALTDGLSELHRLISEGYYSPPPWGVISVSNQQLTPIPSRCRVESNRERDARRATGRKVVLVVFSGTLLS